MLQFQSLTYLLSKIVTKLASRTSITNKFNPINAYMSNLPTNPTMSFYNFWAIPILPKVGFEPTISQPSWYALTTELNVTSHLASVKANCYSWVITCVFIDIYNCQLPLTRSTIYNTFIDRLEHQYICNCHYLNYCTTTYLLHL